ncbi:mediator complex, subunit Med21 [Neohortaea acidophila]|uniref:Mediator of RNA polymerase II transcription subunit 21 n=1 Tax=Neohortaea acidophila TaxID=245834 RepID=A0A6A6PJ47_9PEZI|nr:mediator complex, subunit Med21 [Neohortaea acidophila]KAF2479553.1 mediator complex, subunit Med21 [Neohortaea acidophila]
MADRLTQLQDCLDDLLTQMYASLSYIQNRHPYGDIPGQPSQAPDPAAASTPAATNGEVGRSEAPETPLPEAPDRFQATMHELARDLVLKEQQIEILINSLPGIGAGEADQNQRIRELEAELTVVEKERAKAEKERERLVDALGQVIVGVKRPA